MSERVESFDVSMDFDDAEPLFVDDSEVFEVIAEPSESYGGIHENIEDFSGSLMEPIPVPELAPAPVAREDSPPPVPAERVRFTMPATLRSEQTDETVEGVVLNLSVQGVACVGALPARPGERLWVTFKLGLAEAPMTLLTEVIWCAPLNDERWTCGMRFRSLTAAESQRIDAAVRERVEGRAGEWPLPMMPQDETETAASRSPNVWMAVAAGMAAGIGLSLAVAAIPVSESTSNNTPPLVVESAVASVEQSPTPVPVVSLPEQPIPASEVPTAAVPQEATDVAPVVAPAVAPTQPEPASKLAAATETAPESSLPRLADVPEVTEDDGQGYLRPTGSRTEMSLALLTDGPVTEHVAFWLQNPQRLVIDVPHRKSGFAKSRYGIEHPLATRLRVGNHPDKVRFVIETTEKVSHQLDAQARGNALVITVQR